MKLFIAPAFFSVAASYECPPGDAACQAGDEDNALLSLRASVKRHVATEMAQREACDPRATPPQICGNGMSCRAVCPSNWFALGLDSCPCDGSWLQRDVKAMNQTVECNPKRGYPYTENEPQQFCPDGTACREIPNCHWLDQPIDTATCTCPASLLQKKATSQNNTQCNPKRGYPYTEDEPQQFCPSGLACRDIPDCDWRNQPIDTATCTCPASLLQKKATSYCNPQETNPVQKCPNGEVCSSICPEGWEVLALESCACPDSDSHATEAPTEAPATEAPATEAPVTASYCNPQETNPEQECPDGRTCRSICPKDWEVLALESCACPASLLQKATDSYCNPQETEPEQYCPNGKACHEVCPPNWRELALESCDCDSEESHATEAPATEAPATEAPATEAPVTTTYCNPQEHQLCPNGDACSEHCPKDWEVLALESCACPASLLQEDPTEEAPADVYCNPTFNAPQEMCPNGQGCRDLGVCPLGWLEKGLESCRCPDKAPPALLQDEPTEEMQEELAEHIAKGEDGSTKCPGNSKPMTYILCAEASAAAGLDGVGNMNASPPGCYVQGGKWYFNYNSKGTGLKGKSVACMKEESALGAREKQTARKL